jgi:hypothetical protein
MNKKGLNILLLSAPLLSFIFSNGCSSSKNFSRGFIQQNNRESAQSLLGNFSSLWKKKTVQLKAPLRNNLLSGGNNQFEGEGMTSGRRTQGGGFNSISAEATYLDSVIVSTGIDEFSQMAGLNNSEKVLYRENYLKNFKTNDYIVFWLELRTPYTEEVLNTKNWNFFFEDDKGAQTEAASITEINEKDDRSSSFLPFESGNMYNKVNSKTIILFFPKKRYNGSPIFENGKQNVKLVMYNWNDQTRLEGIINN